ncbi:glycosyltransferase family 2 protein [Candidatus Njordibacter sp. Uisw_039]|uniref:glycosyltransferase family 2 protein n=1 Tax=Candidatus Njordibacter sp. Uisw_039 TaxID=3230972 RepID=UPI003D404FE8
MTNAPLISIVIPTYNHAHYLALALNSVIDQTYIHWEAIVIDNHSADNTESIVLSFDNPKIKLLKIHNNGVIGASRNLGLNEAKGDWIAFLDSDDSWYPSKLETVVKNIRQDDEIDVFSTDEMQVNEMTGAKQILRYGPYASNFYQVLLTEGNRVSPSATLVRHKFMIENKISFRENINFVTVEDYDFWMLLAKAGAQFKFIAEVQGEAMVHPHNASGQTSKHKNNLSNVLKDHVFNIQSFEPNKEKLWKDIKVRLLILEFKERVINKKYFKSLKYLSLAFFSSPKFFIKISVNKILINKIIKNF